jgi:hypothetical protein
MSTRPSAIHYRRSDGSLVEITRMATSHAAAAAAKLKREEPHRAAEISALEAHAGPAATAAAGYAAGSARGGARR